MKIELNNGGSIEGKDLQSISLAEWIAKGEALFGKDKTLWQFKCPNCGHVQTPRDFIRMCEKQGIKDLSPENAWFSCIGRWLEIPDEKVGTIFAKDKGKQPCNYTNGGLFCFAKMFVIGEDGKNHAVFSFNDDSSIPPCAKAEGILEMII